MVAEEQQQQACTTEKVLSPAVHLHGVVVGSQYRHAVEAGAHCSCASCKPARADECGPLHGSQHAWIHIHRHCALFPAPLGPLDGLHKRCSFGLFHLQQMPKYSVMAALAAMTSTAVGSSQLQPLPGAQAEAVTCIHLHAIRDGNACIITGTNSRSAVRCFYCQGCLHLRLHAHTGMQH